MTIYDLAEHVERLHPAVERCGTCGSSEVEIRADGHRFDFFGVWIPRHAAADSYLPYCASCPEEHWRRQVTCDCFDDAKVDLAGGED